MNRYKPRGARAMKIAQTFVAATVAAATAVGFSYAAQR